MLDYINMDKEKLLRLYEEGYVFIDSRITIYKREIFVAHAENRLHELAERHASRQVGYIYDALKRCLEREAKRNENRKDSK